MANIIKIKNSVTTSNTPSSLEQGEMGVNITDKKIWFGNAATTPVLFNDTLPLTNPTVTNYTETPYSANSSTAITLSLSNGTIQIITLTGNCTFTFPTAVSGKSFLLLLRQDGTGSRTVTWPASVKWPSGNAPTITSTASKQDILAFVSDGTNWYGSGGGQNYTV